MAVASESAAAYASAWRREIYPIMLATSVAAALSLSLDGDPCAPNQEEIMGNSVRVDFGTGVCQFRGLGEKYRPGAFIKTRRTSVRHGCAARTFNVLYRSRYIQLAIRTWSSRSRCSRSRSSSAAASTAGRRHGAQALDRAEAQGSRETDSQSPEQALCATHVSTRNRNPRELRNELTSSAKLPCR
jgi:hypothetical protein